MSAYRIYNDVTDEDVATAESFSAAAKKAVAYYLENMPPEDSFEDPPHLMIFLDDAEPDKPSAWHVAGDGAVQAAYFGEA